MITCRELIEVLVDLETGDLPVEHRKRVEHHLGHCSSCVAFVESYRLIVQMPRHLPRPALPVELQQRLQTMLAFSHRK